MKRWFFTALTAAALAGAFLLTTGCPTISEPDAPKNPVYKYAQEFWGEWVRMDSAETWYINGNAIKINDTASARTVALKKQSARVIEVTESGQKYYLYASRIANATFTGRVAGFGQAQQSTQVLSVQGLGVQKSAAESKGWIDVVIEDLDNGATTTATTGEDGTFTVPKATPGDTYEVTPEGGDPVTVTPATDGDDIGTITVSKGVNFKTTIVPADSSIDMNELYAGTNYSFNLRVTHTGTENCTAATYEIEFDEGLSVTGALDDMFRTIEPRTTRTVGLAVSCSVDAIPQDKIFKKIRIAITDHASGKTYEDSVSLKFHKRSASFSIRSETGRGISGVLIAPTGKTYSFINTANKTIVAPWLVDDYLLVFSGATVATEAVYSFTVDGTPDTNYPSFRDLGNYEPNNTEDTAPRLGGKEKVMSYLWVNDIDYYRINLTFDNVAPGQPTVVAGDQELSVSWSEVVGATAYEVWYGTANDSSQAQKYGEDVTDLSTTITGLEKGTGYYVWIKAKRGETISAFSPTAMGTTAPDVPVISSVSAGNAGELVVRWGAVNGAASYNLYYNTADDSASATLVSGVTSPYTITGLSGITTYYVWVKAKNAAGESDFSAAASGTTVLPAPAGLTASANSVTLRWTAVTEASTYTVYRSASAAGPYSQIASGISDLVYTDTGTNFGTTYYYKVTAVNGALESAKSAYVAATSLGLFIQNSTSHTPVLDVALPFSIANALAWLGSNAEANTSYVAVLDADESLGPQTLSQANVNGKTGVSITLKGYGAERTVTLSSNGELFTVGSGVTLILDENVTLKGRSNNTSSVVRVSSGGAFIMKGGKISGNTNITYSDVGGGVYVEGTFTMSGGEISGNTAFNPSSYSTFSSSGGGVNVATSGTFTMSGGNISGNTSSTSTFAPSCGGGVYVAGGTFTMSGGNISGNTTSTSSFGSSFGGGVFVASNGTFTMSGGNISSNTTSTTSSTSSYGYSYGGGVFVESNGTFTMSGGEISGNTASSNTTSSSSYSYGSGVYVRENGTFKKQPTDSGTSGVIYGYTTGEANSNKVTGKGGSILSGYGHAVYTSSSKKRETTAGVTQSMDSTVDGTAGGWE